MICYRLLVIALLLSAGCRTPFAKCSGSKVFDQSVAAGRSRLVVQNDLDESVDFRLYMVDPSLPKEEKIRSTIKAGTSRVYDVEPGTYELNSDYRRGSAKVLEKAAFRKVLSKGQTYCWSLHETFN